MVRIPDVTAIRHRLRDLEEWFRTFGWFPPEECRNREQHYHLDEWRHQTLDDVHIRLEYRKFPSWLYSKELATLVLGFARAAVLRPNLWDRGFTGAPTRPKLLRMAVEAWGREGIASRILQNTRALDEVDTNVDLKDVWG
jgi:hypothetical protein